MIAIIGGGVCGLGIGWRIAQAGRPVTVLDRGRAGAGASWAAAGMLAPQVEAEPSEEPLLALTQESRDLWADFAAEVEAAVPQVDVRVAHPAGLHPQQHLGALRPRRVGNGRHQRRPQFDHLVALHGHPLIAW